MTTHPNPSGLTIGAWRTANGQGDTWEYFLDRTTIITESNDPADTPGIHHAIRLLSNNPILLPTYYNETEEIRTLLLKKNYKFWRERHMSIGSVIDGRWKVSGELTDNCIMKLLPTEAMLPGAAKRETDILGALAIKTSSDATGTMSRDRQNLTVCLGWLQSIVKTVIWKTSCVSGTRSSS
jgi:hypothetical protein